MHSEWKMQKHCLCRPSSSKYAPLPWNNYFDAEKDVAITGTDDVSLQPFSQEVIFILQSNGEKALLSQTAQELTTPSPDYFGDLHVLCLFIHLLRQRIVLSGNTVIVTCC
jgi:hypothetical protein